MLYSSCIIKFIIDFRIVLDGAGSVCWTENGRQNDGEYGKCVKENHEVYVDEELRLGERK